MSSVYGRRLTVNGKTKGKRQKEKGKSKEETLETTDKKSFI